MSRISRREMRDLALSWHILKFPVIFPVRSPDLPRVFPGSCREKNRDLNKISGIQRTGNAVFTVCQFVVNLLRRSKWGQLSWPISPKRLNKKTPLLALLEIRIILKNEPNLCTLRGVIAQNRYRTK